MTFEALLYSIRHFPETVSFTAVINTIQQHYDYTPARFSNGVPGDMIINEAGKNEGSCKIFAFALLHGLNADETLACFGNFYRRDVLDNPAGQDHANIRTFIRHGLAGLQFERQPLTAKQSGSDPTA